MNVAVSFFAGSVIAWGIIGPALVHNGVAWGIDASEGDPNWDGLMNFYSLSKAASNKDHPSPRYWLLWPGVLLMIAVSFTGESQRPIDLFVANINPQNLPCSTRSSGLLSRPSTAEPVAASTRLAAN